MVVIALVSRRRRRQNAAIVRTVRPGWISFSGECRTHSRGVGIVCARHLAPRRDGRAAEVRDDAEDILRATALDMQSDQTGAQQAEKSKGASRPWDESGPDAGIVIPRSGRVGSGFDLWAVIAEYRALRASVLRLWRESDPAPDLRDLDDLTRFNESIDQSLTHAVRSYAEQVERDREALLANEQASRRGRRSRQPRKDVFLATLSHEMRTPLNAIVGWLSILRHEDAETRHLQEGLKVIERNTKAQVQLIDDLLDVSRIVSGKLRVDIRPCELADVINAGVNAVRPAAEARGITLDVQLDPSASGAWCDSVRIQQVVWNLVSNAVKFTPKGGRVDVTLSREQSSFQIQVSDNGQGISPNCCHTSLTVFARPTAVRDGGSPGWGWGFPLSNTSWKRMAGRSKPPARAKAKARPSPSACRFMRCGSRGQRRRARSQAVLARMNPRIPFPSPTAVRRFVSMACACSSWMTKPTPAGSWSWCWNESAPSSPQRAAPARRLKRFRRRARTCWSATSVCRTRTAST